MDKKYSIICDCCKKQLNITVEVIKIGNRDFVQSMKIGRSKCKCIRETTNLHDLLYLMKQISYLENNKDLILKEIDKED